MAVLYMNFWKPRRYKHSGQNTGGDGHPADAKKVTLRGKFAPSWTKIWSTVGAMRSDSIARNR